MRRTRWEGAAGGVALVAALWAGGCATTTPPNAFDRYVEEGRYDEAARTFEADSTLWTRPDALLLAGSVFSDPSRPTYDAARGRAALERLMTAFPATVQAAEGRPILALLVEIEKVRAEMAAQAARTVELEQSLVHADSLAAAAGATERELQSLRRSVQRLESELEQARQELERLKAIDLRPRPGGGR